jgi:Tannase and feruloyl esterase
MKLRRLLASAVVGATLCALMVFAARRAAGSPPQSSEVRKPTVTCEGMAGKSIAASMIGLPTNGAKITSAKLMPAADAPPPTPGPFGGPGVAVPEYCAVSGAIAPIDPSAPEIRFQVDIPTQWKGEAIQEGGGGMDGIITPIITDPSHGALQGTLPGAPSVLTQGFALYGSDSGHQNPAASPGAPPAMAVDWMKNDESWSNFAHQQIKKTHDAVFEILQTMYGAKPRSSYFVGTSQGGREAMEAVSRYGRDYDGVMAHVPVVYFAGLLMDPTLKADSQEAPGTWVPPAKGKAVAAETLRLCDALDGLQDGVISDYVGCNRLLDPAVTPDPLKNIRCPGGEDTGNDCLSDKQMKTVNSFHSPERFTFAFANGEKDWPGWGTGLEGGTAMPGPFGAWLTTPKQPNADDPSSVVGGIGGMAVKVRIAGSADFNLATFDCSKYAKQIQTLSDQVDPRGDWSAFFKHGGKLFIFTGASDYISNPRAQMRLYEEAVKHSGQKTVDEHVRYYISPNVGHSLTGVAANGTPLPSAVDSFAYIRGWVEQHTAPPDAMPQSRYSKGAPYTVEASRPLCQYPKYPRYKGSGDATSADSYVCAMP